MSLSKSQNFCLKHLFLKCTVREISEVINKNGIPCIILNFLYNIKTQYAKRMPIVSSITKKYLKLKIY